MNHSASRIATVTLNPALDRTVAVPNFTLNALNRVVWARMHAGGKGVNVASFLADYGFAVTAAGFLGAENAQLFEQHPAAKGIQDRFTRVAGKTRVNIKIVDEVRHQITDVNFPGVTPGPEDVAHFDKQVDELARDHEWFVVSGSLPSGLPVDFCRALVQRLKTQDRRVVLDTSGPALKRALNAVPFAIKPNQPELEEVVGHPLANENAVWRAARSLIQQGIQCVIVSRGAAGAMFITHTDAVTAHPPPNIRIRGTVGAGDAMVAGFVAATLLGLSLVETARLATAFAAARLGSVRPLLPPKAVIQALAQEVKVQTL